MKPYVLAYLGAIVWVGKDDPASVRKDIETLADTQTSAIADRVWSGAS